MLSMGLNADFEKLDINGKDVEDWFDRFDLYCKTNASIDKDNKTAYLLTLAGGQAYKLVKDLAFPKKPDTLSATEIRDLIVNHSTPQTYEVAERSKFNSLSRRPDHSQLEILSSNCKDKPHFVILVLLWKSI